MESILTINNLTKKYGHVTAVKNLSFNIEKGNIYGILGPNGSGKSTTLGIVLNVVNKTSGDYSWYGGKLSTHEALKKVGAIRSEEHTSELQSRRNLVCRLLLEKKK